MAGIYIHIPFCKQACYYCDFHFSTNQQSKAELVQAISKEIGLQKNYLHEEPIRTIYFGGGTPSLLTHHEIELILHAIRSGFHIADNPEITLEANPDDLTITKLNELAHAGINRLSVGIQSFNSSLLKFLNRAHDRDAALKSFNDARGAGFKNISIDLIYAIPGETDEQWLSDIHQAIALQPEHISCYSLTIEEKTAFGKWAASGKLKAEPDEVSARHFEMLMDSLTHAGYEHYEISNFARPGFYSKHNSNYWLGEKYLGVGPSAHSFDGASRQYTVSNNNTYLKSIQHGLIPFEKEVLSIENKINEYILTNLRTSWGVNVKTLQHEYAHDLLNTNPDYISQLLEKKLAVLENGVFRLTNKGKLLADKISSDLFVS